MENEDIELKDALAEALMKGDGLNAYRLVSKMMKMDTELSIGVEGKVLRRDIYEKLIEMGIDELKASELATSHRSFEEAFEYAFK